MKRITFAVSLLALLASSAFGPVAAETLHTIRYGDTLWELAIQYYNNPFLWESILEANPGIQITYLEPGTTLLIPFTGEQNVQSGVYATAGLTSSRSLLSRLLLETTGMLTDDPPQPVGYVIETNADENDEFGDETAYPGDWLALDIGQDQGIEIGRVFKIMQVGEDVRHPDTGEHLGQVIRAAGVCRVIETAANSSIAVLEHSYLRIHSGDFLLPYTSYAPIEVSGIDVIEGMDAWVVAFKDSDPIQAYSFDVIYIDRGATDGLNPGDLFNMFKYGNDIESPSGDVVTTPDIPIAEIIVLETLPETSAAMIISNSAVDLVSIGDRIELVKKQR